MSRQPDRWAGLALALSDDVALVGPQAAALLLILYAVAERELRRDRIAFSPALQEVRRVLRAVADTQDTADLRIGHGDTPTHPGLSRLGGDEITTAEAGAMTGLSARHVRRLARAGLLGPAGVRRGAMRLVRAEVAAYAAQRKASA